METFIQMSDIRSFVLLNQAFGASLHMTIT